MFSVNNYIVFIIALNESARVQLSGVNTSDDFHMHRSILQNHDTCSEALIQQLAQPPNCLMCCCCIASCNHAVAVARVKALGWVKKKKERNKEDEQFWISTISGRPP